MKKLFCVLFIAIPAFLYSQDQKSNTAPSMGNSAVTPASKNNQSGKQKVKQELKSSSSEAPSETNTDSARKSSPKQELKASDAGNMKPKE